MSSSAEILAAAQILRDKVNRLSFDTPVTHVYNPLNYAWAPHKEYIERYGNSQKDVLFLGMNPGPWGMTQTGVPFGEIDAVKNWMGIQAPVARPESEHPKRPVTGFDCEKSEVSGRRLWGLFREQFTSPDAFFEKHYVVSFCPLVFLEESSRNRTPDKLPVSESKPLFEACIKHLQANIEALRPKWLVGIGGFAQKMIKDTCPDSSIQQGKILHPSPASPAANKGWSEAAMKQLKEQGIWA
ncbi:single-stranded DNA-binding protein [Puniceicoccaceae bacterium K14]|nr:single-stranded DNA-binding protein [Puniceicoccaceae bacterium K14]